MQIESGRDVLEIGDDFRLRWKASGINPVGEGIAVEDQPVSLLRCIRPSPGIPVVVLNPAHTIAGLKRLDIEAHGPEPPRCVEPSEPGAHDDHVELIGVMSLSVSCHHDATSEEPFLSADPP